MAQLGYAMGELVVLTEAGEDVDVDKNKIYVFYNPPSDLKPVAGILTVTEGNMVSHVQLLARNLAIPNAVLSASNMEDLKKYSGKKVFYAVSNQGTVLMKSADAMSESEKALFAVSARKEERIMVPIEKIDLNQKTVLNMRNVNASHSGKTCGPKAANLGQLKLMFPDQVVEGLIVPFGIFRDHLDQAMPGQNGSYWDFLQATFEEAGRRRKAGDSEESIEQFSLGQLEILREAIKKMELKPSFVSDLEAQFKTVLGKELGKAPVFLRSDTNMEDLKDFTGAGLNLTVFNVVDKAKIMQGIKDVWASPYTERSFKWRQRYLLNPENVFPSILIIPSLMWNIPG
ncbi:MAG: PEP/pyruvate-binding domain-containing protein [Bacteroidia bacterium]